MTSEQNIPKPEFGGRATDTQVAALTEALIRLEAKIDVVLQRHEGKIDDLTRRQAENTSALRDNSERITQNTLSLAEARATVTGLAEDVRGLEKQNSERGGNTAAWAAVAVAVLAVVISPILTALLGR